MAATCMAVCKGSRKKIRGIFISSCHLPVAVECDIVILSEPGPIPQAPVGQFCRHNLSPRGDGNVGHGHGPSSRLGTQLIPARGRKRAGGPRRGRRILGHNLSPRGDGNDCLQRSSQISARHNLSPRGDGNLGRSEGHYYDCSTQLIPARGRKLHTAHDNPQRQPTQLIPARGRKQSFLFSFPI